MNGAHTNGAHTIGAQRRHGPIGSVGLPEAVGFALGAGVMAKALVALEATLSENERARRLARDGGVVAELERAAADLGRRLLPLARESAVDVTEFVRSHVEPHVLVMVHRADGAAHRVDPNRAPGVPVLSDPCALSAPALRAQSS